MTLTFNSRHLPRSLTEWDQLVTACGVRDDTIETHWLERKGAGLKLSTAEGKFTLAKAILAFANRDPETAQPYLDGHALILIGIENTGEITGVPRIEDHQLLNGLKAFLGQGDSAPRWTTHRVRVDDENDVLIINVDAPRAGDPLFTLRKANGNFHEGFIFARPSTESAGADSHEISLLSRRLLAGARQNLDVALTLNPDAISSYSYDPDCLNPLLTRAVQGYLSKLAPPPPPPPPAKSAKQRMDFEFEFPKVDALRWGAISGATRVTAHHEEDRTEDQFRAEVETWAEEVRRQLPYVARQVASYLQPAAEFTLTNRCGRFLENVEADVHIEGDVVHHTKPGDHDDINEWLPLPPRPWGPWETPRFQLTTPHLPIPNIKSGIFTGYDITIRNSGSVSVTLSCAELRPDKSYTFDEDDVPPFALLTTTDLTNARITYKVTARGIDDIHTEEILHPVQPAGDITPRLLHLFERYFNPPKR